MPQQSTIQTFGTHIRFEQPTDYLRYTDYDLLNERLHSDDYLKSIIADLRNRRLMRKALVISSNTIPGNFDEMTRLLEHPYKDEIIIGLREQIHNDVPANFGLTIYDIEIDLPPTISLNEATLSVVQQPGGELVPLNRLFPSTDWLTAFAARKWRGHVFCRGTPEAQVAVGKAAKKVLEEEPYNLRINDLALSLAQGASPT